VSTESLGWEGGSTRGMGRGTVAAEEFLKREPLPPRHCFEAEPKNAAGGGGFGGNELNDLEVLDSIWRNFASIIAILLSVLTIQG